MIRSRAVRLTTLAAATALLVLATPATASAQCSGPNYRGTRTFPGGDCPEPTAIAASGTVWALLLLAAGLWLTLARRRSRSATTADLALVDATFTQAATTTATTVADPAAAHPVAPTRPPPATPPTTPLRPDHPSQPKP
ncbi:hypothetical protein [Streptomyces sp. NPDC048638]|uniref:hypothetical protein n=1 Tax=Streptomyces sp. NPDC048638 TaxID=3365580 RepID=UPI00371FFF2E